MGRVGVDRVVVGVLSVTIHGMGNLVVYRRGVYELIERSYWYRVLWDLLISKIDFLFECSHVDRSPETGAL